MGMSEWLIACAALLFLVVLVDGVRRMRAERRQEIKWDLQLARDLEDETDDDYGNGELLDAYRVVDRPDAIESDDDDAISTDARNIPGGDSRNQADLFAQGQQEEGVLESASPIGDIGERDVPADKEAEEHGVSNDASSGGYADAEFADENLQLIVLHVKAKQPQGFSGSDIIQVLVACNLRYGEKQILHRFVDPSANQGPIEFSVANMVEPGIFDLDRLSDFRSPGVTFFMALPGTPNPVKSFNTMVETASYVAKTLDGDLLDEEHSSATQQVINHYRDRIRELSAQFAES